MTKAKNICRYYSIFITKVTYTKKVSKVLKGAAVLATAGLVAKIIGVLYRIPLTNIVGSVGIGLYQMIFPLYVVLLTISSGGLPIAISKVVAERLAKGDEKGARKVLRVALISLTSIGAVLSVVLFVLARLIARLQGNELAALGYMGIAPAIVFVAIIACFRGYYQGKQNMVPSALSQIIEQIIKLGVGLVLAMLLLSRGVEYAVLGALIGVSLSEAVAACALWLQYLVGRIKEKRRDKKEGHPSVAASRLATVNVEFGSDFVLQPIRNSHSISNPYANNKNLTAIKKEKPKSVLREIYRIAIPVTLGSLIIPLTQLLDSAMVINLLVRQGVATETATGLFGLLTGPVGTLINMPAVITLSLAVALLPKIAECMAKKECAGRIVSQSLKFSFIFGLLATLTLAIFARPILSLLYSSGLSNAEITYAARLLTLGAISIIYVSIMQVATSVLQGVGKAHIPAINLLVGAAIKIGLTFLLLPRYGIMGAIIASVACFSIVCVLDIFAMRKFIKLDIGVKEFLLVPLLAGVSFAGVAILLNWSLSKVLPSLAVMAISGVVSLGVFITIIFALKSVRISDFKKLKFFNRLLNRKKQKNTNL